MRLAVLALVIAGCGASAPPSPPSLPPAPSPSLPPSPAPPADPSPPPSSPDNPRPQPVAESPLPAKFGQALEPGLYVFPDGLRLKVVQTANCDFDTSVPCFGGTYQADATFDGKDARVTWSTRSAKILGHTIEVASFKLIVRK